MRYIRVAREVMEPSRKQNFDGGGDQGYHRIHWERRGGHSNRNSEGQHHGNGARFVGGRRGHCDVRDGNNGGGRGARGGNGNNINPPPTKTGRKCRAAVKTFRKEVGRCRENN